MVELVKYHDKHKENLARLANNIEVAKWLLSFDVPYTENDAQEFIDFCKSSEDHLYAIEVDGSYAGSIGLHKKHAHSSEIGYWIGQEYWGKGYTTEAIRKITQYAFDELGLVRIQAHVFEDNIGSEKVLLKNGFEFEGLLKKAHSKNGVFYNSKLFAKVK